MEYFLKGYSRRRIILMISLLILAVIVVNLICSFTSQNTVVSNAISKKIARAIENFAGNFFEVDHRAVFWRKTLNLIVRKIAHFFEYMILGVFVCALISVALNNCRRAAKITFAGCTALGVTDEFRQLFVSGRTARLTDVLIDMTGAALGITLAIIVFIAVWRINNPNAVSKFKI